MKYLLHFFTARAVLRDAKFIDRLRDFDTFLDFFSLTVHFLLQRGQSPTSGEHAQGIIILIGYVYMFYVDISKKSHVGIEPTISRLEVGCFSTKPMRQAHRLDSNQRLLGYEPSALPLSYDAKCAWAVSIRLPSLTTAYLYSIRGKI